MEDGPRIGGRIALFLLLFLAHAVALRRARGAQGLTIGEERERAAEDVHRELISKVIFIGFVLALNLGLDIAPLLAGIGVLGFVVGFALQDTLGNFAAGSAADVSPYDVGDFVEVAGREGWSPP